MTETAASSLALTLRENLRTFRIASWLGWQIESNWADPIVFLIFSILRPMAAALIIVVMYQVIAGGVRDDFFEYLFLSNAFFVLVTQALAGMSWTIFDDRENYKMLKYVYTSPARKFAYLIGRAVGKIGIGILTTLLLLAVGILFLHVRMDVRTIEWGWLSVYFVLGVIILVSLGMVLAGVSLVIARHGEFIGEVTAGSLLLVSSAYFPPDILPIGLKQLSLAVPVTYWLEAMRRSLMGGVLTTTFNGARVPLSPYLAIFSNVDLLLILTISAVVCSIGSYYFFSWVEQRAKEKGMIDRVTGY